MQVEMPVAILVDAHNFDQWEAQIIAELQKVDFAGIDVETHDDNRHEGLMVYSNYNPVTRKKAANTKTVFDIQRTIMTGFSIYPEGSANSYYINLNQADRDGRVTWVKAQRLIDSLPTSAHWIAHNANYELTLYRACYGLRLPRTICTMQMAVSAFGPDEYRKSDFLNLRQGGLKALVPDLTRKIRGFDPEKPREMKKDLAEVVNKILAKESKAAHSYNGYVKEIAYSYGLKRLVKVFFGHQMTTYDEVLDGKAHMGLLTGAEVVSYGADDSVWAVRLFRTLMTYMAENCPKSINAFFTQENPMVEVYSDVWFNGLKVNTANITNRRALERAAQATALREFKGHLKAMMPFPMQNNAALAKADKWYADNWEKYRKQLVDFTNLPDSPDDYKQAVQVRGPVSNAWAAEMGDKEPTGVNLGHYMPQRTMLYDLAATDPIIFMGKTQSDGEARGKLKERFQANGNTEAVTMIEDINTMAGIDQRMKLYLTPYSQLMDPDTGRLYPTLSSMLASRRMATTTPNPMQLTKRGESTYVRGFFEPDYDDHVIISVDWSGIELVEIGEFSADPEFIKAFGQIPHEDLHGGAAASVLGVEVPGLTEEIFKSLKKFEHEDDFRREYADTLGNMNRLFTDVKGETIPIQKAFKYWRTTIGKGANFGFWYSGFLGTTGDLMGWDLSTTSKASDAYKERFSVAEAWRKQVIADVRRQGYIDLPDGHRRVRYEATDIWVDQFTSNFTIDTQGGFDDAAIRYNQLWNYMARQIQKRAFNQAVNSVIQGSCATIAKRSVLNIERKKKAMGWTDREARFLLPIHDELLYSVHRDLVVPGIELIRGTMIDHPDLFKHCKLDASPAVGRTFEPWHAKKAPYGQVELYEAPHLDFLPENVWDKRLGDDHVNEVVDYLFSEESKVRMAA